MHGDAGMFIGRAKHTVTKDGRVSIPSKMREAIKKQYDPNELYLVLLPGNVVCLYPDEEFQKLTASWFNNPQGATLSEIMMLERIGGNTEPCKLDGSGRIVIPPLMRQEARITDEVLVIGALTHIEIWDPGLWEWNQKQTQAGLDRFKAWPTQPGIG